MLKFRNGLIHQWALLTGIVFVLALIAGPAMAADKKPIVFADLGWDSAQVHNRIAGFIIQHGLGYPVDYTTGFLNEKSAMAAGISFWLYTDILLGS